MSNFKDFLTKDARLTILRELASQVDYRLNESAITKVLDLFGHRKSREWVRAQLRKLEELGAVTVAETNGVMVAMITQNGLDHVERRSMIEGVKHPSPES
jgi:DNA-binding GntR family transcriptional regulator